jgi:hypothetical protein
MLDYVLMLCIAQYIRVPPGSGYDLVDDATG